MAPEPLGRNENGYIIHPDRADTGELARQCGAILMGSAVFVTVVTAGYGIIATLPIFLLGVYFYLRGRRKRPE